MRRTPTSESALRDLEFLSDVTRETLSSLRINPLLWRVVQLLRRRFGYDFAAIGLVEGERVTFRAASGGESEGGYSDSQNEPAGQVLLGTGVIGRVARSGKARLIGDVRAAPDFVPLDHLEDTRSELTVPIVHSEQTIGVIDVQSHLPDAFDDTDQHLLQIVAALVAPAVSTARAFEAERRRARHLRLVNEISRLVASSLNREEVISLACSAILEALDISFVGIVLLDPSGTRVVHGGHASRLPFVEGFDIDTLSLELGEGVASEAITRGETVRLDEVSGHPLYREVAIGVRSELCVPLRLMGRVIGAIDIEHTKPAHFNAEDEALLENLAGFLAQAIDNARLFDTLRRRWHQLLLINEVARVSTFSIDLQQVLNVITHQIRDRFGYHAVALMLCDDREIVIHALGCEGAPLVAEGYREPIGKGIGGTVAKTGNTIQIDDPAQFAGSRVVDPRVQSILCVPLVHDGRVIGAIQVQHLKPLDEDDRLVIETLAKSVTGSIANARAIDQTERLREDLNRMIVHDLRNPVQSVLFTLQEVSQLELEEPRLESVRSAIQSAADILEMVNSLLDVARFEAGRFNLRCEPGSLNDHVRAVVRQAAPMARSRGIQLTTVLSQEVPALHFDHELIKRMLSNLVGNALKFTPEGGPVTVSTTTISDGNAVGGMDHTVEPPYALISVQDRGEGIPAEYHDKIFEKFGQVESRKAGLKMSTGLGLALCRYVVAAHRGAIWVASDVGQGSTFFVALPVAARR